MNLPYHLGQRRWLSGISIMTIVAAVGCGQPDGQPASDPQPAPSAAEDPAIDESLRVDVDEEVSMALAELSPADRAAALEQQTCPVSDQLLGSMGVPLKVDVDGHDVFICCEGCRNELLANPQQYLAKLGSESATE